MKTDTLKEIWKCGTNKEIRPYSATELDKIMVKSARKSMKTVQMKGGFQIVVIAVMIYIILKLLFGNSSVEFKMLDFAGFLIIFVCFLLSKRSDYKMNKYKCDMPVKEWLEYRIREIEKVVNAKLKYNVLIYGGAFLLSYSFHVVSQILLKASFNLLLSGGIFLGLIVFIMIIKRSLSKKYNQILKELKTLYKQLEESN